MLLPPVGIAITTPETAAALWGPVAGYHRIGGDVTFWQLILFYVVASVGLMALLWLGILPDYLRQYRLRRLLERHGFETAPWKLPKSLPKELFGIEDKGRRGRHFPALVKGARGGVVAVVFDYSPKGRLTFTALAVQGRGSADFADALAGIGYPPHAEAGWTVCRTARRISIETIGAMLAFIPRRN